MIIYGTRAKNIKVDYIAEPCPNCNSQNTMVMNIFQKWAHIFWIPVFPIGKTGASQCTHCMQVLQLKQMTPMLKLSYDNMKSHTHTPIWTFSGIGVIALIAITVTVFDKQKAARVTRTITELKQGDLLHIKLDDGAYTLAKVSRVKNDSVFVYFNSYQTNRATDFESLKSKGYVKDEDVLTIANLKEMDAENQILDIEK